MVFPFSKQVIYDQETINDVKKRKIQAAVQKQRLNKKRSKYACPDHIS